jgi:GTP-binding protein
MYPFTTLEPMLGVVDVRFERFTLADLPGLVEGASEGYGLGFEFLKHIRRCRVLLHLVDSQSPDPVTDYELIEGELRAYDASLDAVPRVVAVTKSDLDAEQAQESAATLAAHLGRPVRSISADGLEGTEDLASELIELVKAAKAADAEAEPDELPVLRPESTERFTVEVEEPGHFRVDGRRIVQFVEMMDLEMEGAVDEVIRRMDRWGVSKALRRAGAVPGSTVAFGESEIEWI